MNTQVSTTENTNETERIAEARESFSGRLLNDTQFAEAIAITQIIEGEIHRTGTFKEALGDYAYTFGRRQRIDAPRAENVLRDLYKGRTGQTMNQTRETLMKREEALTQDEAARGYEHAIRAGERVERGDKIAFSRAYATEAQEFASSLGITHSAARKMMAQEFEAAENMKLSDWGKDLNRQHFEPQIEAEKQERERGRGQSRNRTSSRTSMQSPEQAERAANGWDHANGADATRDRNPSPTRSVPRTGARTYTGPTRSGP